MQKSYLKVMKEVFEAKERIISGHDLFRCPVCERLVNDLIKASCNGTYISLCEQCYDKVYEHKLFKLVMELKEIIKS